MADAVKACGRLGEKWTYACGRSFLRKIIRAHRRFCCVRCDQHIAARSFKEHRAYRERLHPSGTLHQLRVRSSDYPISSGGVRDFEATVAGTVRLSFGGCQGWGLKFSTDYEEGCLVARGIIYLPPGVSLPPKALQIPSATCSVGRATPATAFEVMLADSFRPSLTEERGILRADLMAAFHSGKHLRSLGVFYGLISKKRKEKLPLNTDSGTTSVEPQHLPAPSSLPCSHCGPGCQRVSVSYVPIPEFLGVPNLYQNSSTDGTWSVMQGLLRRKYVF